MANCPTCGQSIVSIDDVHALLDLLTNGEPHRMVYRGRESGDWHVTYRGGKVSDAAVRALIKGGHIHPCYSDCPDDAYHVGKTLDTKATLEERKKRGRGAPAVYMDGTREF